MMRHILLSIFLFSSLVTLSSQPVQADSPMIIMTIDHLKQDISRRIKEIRTSDLDSHYKRQALSQLRHMKSRLNTANNLKNIKSQESAAQDICNQLTHELTKFDRRIYEYKLACSKKGTKKNNRSST